MKGDLQRPEVAAGVGWGAVASLAALGSFVGAALVGLAGGVGAALLYRRTHPLSWRRSLYLGAPTGFLGAIVLLVLGTLLLYFLSPDRIDAMATTGFRPDGERLLHVWFSTLLLGLSGGALAILGAFGAWGGVQGWNAYQRFQARKAARAEAQSVADAAGVLDRIDPETDGGSAEEEMGADTAPEGERTS